MTIEVALDLHLDHGRLVLVRVPSDERALAMLADVALAPEERAACARFSYVRRRTWVAGRAALREALRRSGLLAPPILADERGAPQLPPDVAGSISHKEHVAAGLASPRAGASIGVDLEADDEPTIDISHKVLADDELASIDGLRSRERARATLMRFSAKEAIYKALDPYVRRYVGFKEVSVHPLPGGRVDVTARLPHGEGPFVVEARWLELPGLFVTTARIAPITAPPRA